MIRSSNLVTNLIKSPIEPFFSLPGYLPMQQKEFCDLYIKKGIYSKAVSVCKYPIIHKSKGRYYIYFLVDTLLDKIFYVGKGRNDRLLNHGKEYERNKHKCLEELRNNKRINISNYKKMKEMETSGSVPKEVIFMDNLDENKAYYYESEIINRFYYCNLTNYKWKSKFTYLEGKNKFEGVNQFYLLLSE